MNKHFQFVLLFLSLCIADTSYAQTENIDSLENILKTYKTEDTVKINLLNEIAFLVYKNDADKAQDYANQAVELSDKLLFLKGKVKSTYLIGLSYSKSDKLKAIEYYQKALKIAEEIKYIPGIDHCLSSLAISYKSLGENFKTIECYQKGVKMYEELNDKLETANWLQRLSMIYRMIGNYEEAIEGFQKALRLFEELEEKQEVANCLNSLGIIFAYQGNYPIALEHFQKYLIIKGEQNDSSLNFQGLINIGNIYSSLSDYPKALEHFQKALKIAEEQKVKSKISNSWANIGYIYLKTNDSLALECFQKALKYNEERNDKLLTISTLIYIGDFYLQQVDFDKAMINYSKAQKMAEELGKKRPDCEALNKIGTIYLKQKKYSAALSYTLKSLAIANELKLLNTQKDIHNQLSEIYAATNDYKNAYINHKLYKALNDSLFGEENVKKITGLEYSYKYEKEKQANELEQQKKDAIQAAEKKQQGIIIFSLIGGFVLMFLLAVYVYRSYRIKNKTNIILTKQKEEIEAKNKELLQLNEEILAQRDEIETKNSKLQELNATKDKFFSIIAHDLKNPFNTILGFSNLLVNSKERFNQEEILKYVSLINSSAQNAYTLLENLLEWSMSQTEGIDFKPTHLALENLVIENEKLCENIAKTKGISIQNKIDGNLILYADQNMLSTILRNLITNAIKYTHKGGNITITSTVQNTEIIITVSDSGIGMDEDTRNNLFKISEKSSILGTEKEKGTGLGLILCKEFVNAHGGEIWVESELGKGSDFKFSIPIK
jgi:signal transduction histidine kinase